MILPENTTQRAIILSDTITLFRSEQAHKRNEVTYPMDIYASIITQLIVRGFTEIEDEYLDEL